MVGLAYSSRGYAHAAHGRRGSRCSYEEFWLAIARAGQPMT